MQTFASIWFIWLIAILACFAYAMIKDWQIFLSIVRDDRETFNSTIYRRMWKYGLGLTLAVIFLVMLIASGIANLIVLITD